MTLTKINGSPTTRSSFTYDLNNNDQYNNYIDNLISYLISLYNDNIIKYCTVINIISSLLRNEENRQAPVFFQNINHYDSAF
jgi:hypothetical protein